MNKDEFKNITAIINNKLLLLSTKIDKAIEKSCETHATQYVHIKQSKDNENGYIEILCNSDAYGIKLVATPDNYMYLECHTTYPKISNTIKPFNFMLISERVSLLKDIIVKRTEYLSYRSSESKKDLDELIQKICELAEISECELKEYKAFHQSYNKINKLIEYINDSKNIIFFGGAGVSTESGIPDFRSKDGLYNQHDVNFDQYAPEYLLSKDCLDNNPEVFYEFYHQKLDCRNIEPNITHKVLTELEEMGKLKAIVTQNIDGLHQKAGSENVYEIHGSIKENYCIHCGKKYDENYIFNNTDEFPICEECGHVVRPNVVLYGENVANCFEDAVKIIEQADCLIIGGTSLAVYPAASLISHFHGKHLIVINNEPVNCLLDPDHDLEIVDTLGSVFSQIEEALTQTIIKP